MTKPPSSYLCFCFIQMKCTRNYTLVCSELIRCVNDYLTVQMSGLGAESSDKGLLFIVWLYILSFL